MIVANIYINTKSSHSNLDMKRTRALRGIDTTRVKENMKNPDILFGVKFRNSVVHKRSKFHKQSNQIVGIEKRRYNTPRPQWSEVVNHLDYNILRAQLIM